MIPDARANAMLDTENVTGDKFSLHTAFSLTGANEVSGGSYARQAVTYSAASGRSKAISSGVSFAGLPASCNVAWVGRWDTSGATFKGMEPNGGSANSFQVDLTNNRIYCEGIVGTGAGQVQNGDTVTFTGSTLMTNTTAGTVYYVVGATAGDPDYIQVATTSGGSAIDITTNQPSPDARVSKIVVEAYSASGGQHNVNTFSIGL